MELLNVDEFEDFFQLMELSFPDCEYRKKEEQKALFENPRYCVYGMHSDSGKIKAFLSMWKFDNFYFFEHFAVNPQFRNEGLGSGMLKELVGTLNRPVCLEVELPETELACRRIGFYERNGFCLNDFPYVQPAMSEGKKEIPLLLMTTGGRLDRESFETMRLTLYKEVYGIGQYVKFYDSPLNRMLMASDGEQLTGYAGEIDKKEALLKLEKRML